MRYAQLVKRLFGPFRNLQIALGTDNYRNRRFSHSQHVSLSCGLQQLFVIVGLCGLISDKRFLPLIPLVLPIPTPINHDAPVFHLDSIIRMQLNGLRVGSVFIDQDSMRQALRRVSRVDWDSGLDYEWTTVYAVVNIMYSATRFLLTRRDHSGVNAVAEHPTPSEPR